MENYDCTIKYYPGKANVVADALSRQVQVAGLMIKKLHLLEEISYWNPRLEPRKVILRNIVVNSTLLERIKEAQEKDTEVQKWVERVKKGENSDFNLGMNGILRFQNRIVVPKDEEFKREILEETHRSKFTVQPGGNKIYQELRNLYWWESMKKEIAQFVQTCLVCQQVKAEHQKPSRLLQPLEIPEWK